MNAKMFLMFSVLCVMVLAQSDQKFQLYGFADMALTTYFPKDHSMVRNIPLMDERLMFSLDHLNLYQEYRPNNRVRFLTELSFQDKPPTYTNKNGMTLTIPGMAPMVFNEASLADTNKAQKGIVNYEWGSFSVERAQMSINLNRYFTFTFGKFITPAGIWNVDHGSPVILTVNQPSQYTYREIYPKSQLGIVENGTYIIGDADLTYSLYVSSGRGNPVIKNVGELAGGGQLRLGLPVLDECNIGLSGYSGTQTAVLRSMDLAVPYTINDDRLFRYREYIYGIDFKLRKWGLMLQSEFNFQHVVNSLRDDWNSDSINTDIIGTYVLGSFDAYKRSGFVLTPYAYWELVRYFDTFNNPNLFLNMHDIYPEGSANATTPDMACGYMKIMAGVNMRIASNFGIKAEFNFTRLYMNNSLTDPTSDPNEIAEDEDGLNDIPGVTAQFYIAF
jgi:hypothetical protein